MDFGEKSKEYSPKHGKELPVWQSPKYIESKAKAKDAIEKGKYALLPSDFWILMNATKNEKMAYTGLIISHNGCLKINDCLESKFDPSCVSVDKNGYNNSLVFSYCNPSQGIYEVGEVSPSNCKNEYPYAMAYKRLFDRVVLKLSKLAYAGIYSDSEADEFSQRIDPQKNEISEPKFNRIYSSQKCERCGNKISPVPKKGGEHGEMILPEELAKISVERFGLVLCASCQKEMLK